MARVTFKDRPDFVGQIGSTVFSKGEGETENEGMLAYFAKHPEDFEVEATEPAEDEGPKLTPKQALQADLEARGLPTDGKMDELKARLEAAIATEAEADKNAVEARDAIAAGDAKDGDQGTTEPEAPANGEEV